MGNTGNIGRLLQEERFMQIFADLTNWRVDPYIRQMAIERRGGQIFPFARGLRLSAQLIYLVRELLSGSGLTANWGHLLDRDLSYCSRECDIIIHKNGHFREWDGNHDPVMNFKFIRCENAVAVISCKSYLRTSDIDIEYCKSLKKFVSKVWLFAECCGPKSIKNIRKKARKYGYNKFWPLYTWAKETGPITYKEGWIDFIHEVEKLKTK